MGADPGGAPPARGLVGSECGAVVGLDEPFCPRAAGPDVPSGGEPAAAPGPLLDASSRGPPHEPGCAEPDALLDVPLRGASSAASAASSAIDHIRDWVLGTPEGDWVSMAVPADGSYGIPAGVIYGFPVTCANGSYQIVQGLAINEFSRDRMGATHRELTEERDGVRELL